MLVLNKENISINQVTILRDITLRIAEGEKIALIGPSGVGKTTLLNRLSRLMGEHSAMIPQHLALIPQLSVFHNIYSGRLDRQNTLVNLINLIKPLKQAKDEILSILASLSLEDKLFERVHRLSGGQQQRVAIARALYRKPIILLGDEPFSAIDPGLTETVIKKMLASSSTVVLSIHSIELALVYCPRIIGLHSGRILFDCKASNLTKTMLAELYQHD
jgi:phosphonate transport system ATP-binding protein